MYTHMHINNLEPRVYILYIPVTGELPYIQESEMLVLIPLEVFLSIYIEVFYSKCDKFINKILLLRN